MTFLVALVNLEMHSMLMTHKTIGFKQGKIFRECWYTSYYEVDGRALLLGMYGKIPMEEVITLVDGRPYRE